MLQILRSLGPAVAQVPATEALRAGAGALIALGLTGLFLLSPGVNLDLGLYLVAPFGASSVLLFAVPNSPLAQPWSAIVGNTVAAVVGVAVCMVVADPAFRIALAVALAITATILCRAVHPPAGAVAMTAAMSPEQIEHLGFWFALTPIAAGTAILVVLATIYARLTGRRYPFRQFTDPGTHRTSDRNPSERLGLSKGELTDILERYSQSFNLGVEDLARLIGAAELQAATHTISPMRADDIMSRDLITVNPDTELGEVADLFRRHRFTSIPVVGPDSRFLGIIFQMHLITRAREDALRLDRGFRAAFRRLLDPARGTPVRAGDIMTVVGPRATVDTPIGALLPMMAEGDVDAVPVVNYARLAGIVTRTDLVAALARHAIRPQADAVPAAPG
ncbi:HPP family protein [Falsirhodobacter sp. 20TX0035]|uniref:HPP family protein n=1 Tax=Falsirhodobacter sp. 20TX0035 TaxID=3022019 RepID=UPI00232CB039|nr:HPP family protein [Falsirhodobacter sp. 20TX0035]MDB6455093.1 HPP family protein [Falsirhodobacter sp. 20TX0035]